MEDSNFVVFCQVLILVGVMRTALRQFLRIPGVFETVNRQLLGMESDKWRMLVELQFNCIHLDRCIGESIFSGHNTHGGCFLTGGDGRNVTR